ncbi:MAG: hypothetical protein AAGF33_16775 [Pseudomonadota bacterium]
MSDETQNLTGKKQRTDADITDLTAFIAERKARSTASSQRPLAERLLAGDKPRTAIHPADAMLRALDTKVEAEAQDEARAEIDALVRDVKLTSIAGGATPSPDKPRKTFEPEIVSGGAEDDLPPLRLSDLVAPDEWKWLEDVAMVATAENGGSPIIESDEQSLAVLPSVPAGSSESEEAAEADPVEADEALPEPEPIRLFERSPSTARQPAVIENTPEPQAYVTTTRTAEKRPFFGMLPGSAFDEGEEREALPLWLHLGLPIAAVSAAALAIALNNLSKPDQIIIADADAALPPAAGTDVLPTVEGPEPTTETATSLVEQGLATSPELPLNATVTEEGRVNTFISPAPAPIASVPSAKPDAIPAATSIAPLPSAKPAAPSARSVVTLPNSAQQPDLVAATDTGPNSVIPDSTYDGPIQAGSVADELLRLAGEAGAEQLSSEDARALARDLEEALDTEVDGRSVSLLSGTGDRYRVSFQTSREEVKEYVFQRRSEMGAIPDDLIIEGGWFAATSDAALHATPSVLSVFENETLEPGTLVERIGTVTDLYGDRWYLVGSDGIAAGYVSPADVVIADLYPGDLGQPLTVTGVADSVAQASRVLTDCRTITIGPEGSYWQLAEGCRNPAGHWVSPASGYVVEDIALAELKGAEALVLASASPPPTVLEAPEIRQIVETILPYGSEGQTLTRTLSDGSDVSFTFGERFQESRKISVVRIDALGKIDRPISVDAQWVQVQEGASLRPTPSYQTTLTIGRIEADQAVETIGLTRGRDGQEWTLVGRDGVGFGWVAAAELQPLTGSRPLTAVDNSYSGRAVTELVDAEVKCRTVDYAVPGNYGQVTACQMPSGKWQFEQVGVNFASVLQSGPISLAP